VRFFARRGAILHRNIKGETPLHVAAANGYTKTIQILIETHQHLIDQVEENGVSATLALKCCYKLQCISVSILCLVQKHLRSICVM